jgi:hypothetical protein
MDFLRLAGDIYRQADKAAGGILPGGGTPNPVVRALLPAKAALERSIKEAALNAAAAASNTLPDRVNLYTRYVSGLGNRGLELDTSTINALRPGAEQVRVVRQTVPVGAEFTESFLNNVKDDAERNRLIELRDSLISRGITEDIYTPTYGPGFPMSGAVDPYGSPNAPLSVTNTLGRYSVEARPEKNQIIYRDTYDMQNEAEDPDLISGKSQPGKAWKSIESIWNPAARREIMTGVSSPDPNASNPYTPNSARNLGESFSSSTFSPATQLGRALLYALPVKPKPYDIEVRTPMFSEY